MSYFQGENVGAGACSQIKSEIEMTREDMVGNHSLLLNCVFNVEGNQQTAENVRWRHLAICSLTKVVS